MDVVGASEARKHFSRLLSRISQGERVVITHHGTPVAVLSPVEPEPV